MLSKQDVPRDVSALAPNKLPVTTLKKRADFLFVGKAGKRFACPYFVLILHPRIEAAKPCICVGYTVSKKVSKKAVTRNRIKRRLRQAVREIMPISGKENYDYVFIARGAAETAEFNELTERLRFALKWLHKQAK